MRLLGIETSSRRGSVALVDGGRPVAARHHERPNAHGEALLLLADSVLAEAGWTRSSLDRIAVGVGPGSFTGLRVGIAFAQGIGLGLGIPVVGVGSLASMCHSVPADEPGLRCAVLDARRDELFVAVHDRDGQPVVPARTVPRAGAAEAIAALCDPVTWIVGEAAGELSGPWRHYRSEGADLPHATFAALIAQGADQPPADPLYLRPVDAIRPKLPPSPLS